MNRKIENWILRLYLQVDKAMTRFVLGESSVSAKFQVVLVKGVRIHLPLQKGDKIRFVLKNGQILLEKVPKK
jgi:hypothetical protein